MHMNKSALLTNTILAFACLLSLFASVLIVPVYVFFLFSVIVVVVVVRIPFKRNYPAFRV